MHIATLFGDAMHFGPQTIRPPPRQVSCGKLGSTSGVWLCRVLHYIHHKYNKEHTLSPFAGLAFHPLDGILQVDIHSFVLSFIHLFWLFAVRMFY